MALPVEVNALIRGVHVAAAIVWIGFLYFMTFIRPRVLAGLPEDTRRQIMPHLARHVGPVMMWAVILTIVFGALLYWDMGDRIGYENIGWGLNAGVVLALVMAVLGLAFIVPTTRKTAKVLDGGQPPSPAEIRRLGQVGYINSALSVLVLLFMVGSQRIGAFN